MNNDTLAQNFIAQIWNKQAFENMNQFLHPEFKDHSLPPMLPSNQEGTVKWIINTSISFEHETIIEDQVSQNDKCMIKIRMNLKHIGVWRGINPAGTSLHTTGFRFFKFKDGKIIEHWGLIDGQTIENQLKETTHGCKIGEQKQPH